MNRDDLQRLGFEGFVPFSEVPIRKELIPADAGVYAVSCPSGFNPVFIEKGSGGHFKGQDPNVPVTQLSSEWVSGTEVLYFGKAGPGKRATRGLRKRLTEYAQFGQGKAVGHRGGRLIWQLASAHDLLVSWQISKSDYDLLETKLLRLFKEEFGVLPFANLATKGV